MLSVGVSMVSKASIISSLNKCLSSAIKTHIDQDFAIVYIDDIFLLSNSKEHVFQLIVEQLHIISTKHNLEHASDKSFSMLLEVKILEIGYIFIKPFHSKIVAFHKLLSPFGKVSLMSFKGALNFYKKLVSNFPKILKSFMIFYTQILYRTGH